MRVVLDLGGTAIEFTPKIDTDGPHPYLLSVGTLRVAARAGRVAGLGVGESPSLDVRLDNNERQTAAIVGNPLRAPVLVYEDDGALFFGGAVSRITWGRVITLTLGN